MSHSQAHPDSEQVRGPVTALDFGYHGGDGDEVGPVDIPDTGKMNLAKVTLFTGTGYLGSIFPPYMGASATGSPWRSR